MRSTLGHIISKIEQGPYDYLYIYIIQKRRSPEAPAETPVTAMVDDVERQLLKLAGFFLEPHSSSVFVVCLCGYYDLITRLAVSVN